jgi:LmbE family N-acetylglucosaminyl deacetylase
MTHPDDEISICAWIKKLSENGNPVFLSWSHSTPEREQEACTAASLMQVPADHLHFFGALDGAVVDQIPDLIPEFRTWFKATRPDRVCCGAFEQGHIDHDATNLIVNRSFKGPIFEIPFYHTYLVRLQRLNRFSDPRGEEVRQLERHERIFKRLIARQYPSQNIWSVLMWQEVLSGSRMRHVDLARTERMRLQMHRDFLTPNQPPRLAERVRRCETWKRWETAVRGLKD